MKTEAIKTISIELDKVEQSSINDVYGIIEEIECKMNWEDVKNVEINGVNFKLETIQEMEKLLYDMLF